ncbi:hypothetical protein PN466_19450 [Roseofilum reptotaenium CS-1145]|uniref:Restriction endonuclease domain-containing protein n=1 Tax=Roseofilum reptotaenium AO1-A TaxID=1925591 RepID=A0A1L9QT88_9CYAN|nr:hypothetical protein [Roseofilum reptotaenium]MDB9519125.1 hypothetical protein [Roseofilum reptotaenium CS-1145]OJJ25878.1 hypothetical protein BI308_09070 [Roseofilum reptotaenium AO1-A]
MTQGTARVVPRLTPQEYLEWEVQQPLRYEYFNGEVFAIAGILFGDRLLYFYQRQIAFHY